MTDLAPNRPQLLTSMAVAEFERWYWLKAELQQFARRLGVSASGSKIVLSERISAALAGRPYVEAARDQRAVRGSQLAGPLTAETVIPAGQRCSQHVRAWFADQLGRPFHFDASMRAFFAATSGGQTLGDALRHHAANRTTGAPPIDRQFEFNRFTRAFHTDHPDADRRALLDAWSDYRSRPVDTRGRA